MKFWNRINSINNIEIQADLCRKTGNIAQAKSLYTCLIAMLNKEHGPDSDELALNFFRLAETYADGGNYEAAQTFYRRSAQIWENNHPDRRQNPMWYTNALGAMHKDSNRCDSGQREGRSNKDRRSDVA